MDKGFMCLRVILGIGLLTFVFPQIVNAIPEADAKLITGKITIDGRLREKDWKEAKEYSGFSLLNTGEIPSQKSSFKVLHDKENLYLGFYCQEENIAKIKAEEKNRDEAVWGDDCIEIFLDPAHEKQEYFHLIFNAIGTQFDLLGKEGGRIKTTFWNAYWKAKVFKAKNYWSAEVQIPFASLALTPATKTEWGFNITRERRAGETELSTWALLQGGFHKPALFGTLKIKNDFGRFQFLVGEPEVEITKKKDALQARLGILVENRTSLRGDFLLEASDYPEESHLASSNFSLGSGERKQLSVGPFPIKEEKDKLILLKIKDKNEVLCSSLSEVNFAYQPIILEMKEPPYRNSIFPDQNVDKVKVALAINVKAEKVFCELLDEKGQILRKQMVPPLKKQLISIDIKNLPTGDYTISVCLLSKEAKELAKTEIPLHILPPGKGTVVRVDENVNLIVDGKPFLPNGWFGFEWRSSIRKGYGILPEEVNVTSAAPTDEAIRKYGVYGTGNLQIARLIPGIKEQRNQDELSEEAKRAIRNKVEKLKNHPGLLAWYLEDEPEVAGFRATWLKAEYEYVKKLDPYHPCYISNDTLDGIVKYAGCADIFCPDPYISPTKGHTKPLTKVADFIRKIQEVQKGERPAWVTLQGFSYGDCGQLNGRAPTYMEERAMYFLSITAGAKGFLTYIYVDHRDYPELRIGIPHIQREVSCLAPIILDSAPLEKIKKEPENTPVETWAKFHKENLYIIAVNPQNFSVKARISHPFLRDKKKLSLLSEERKISLIEGSFKEDFVPFAVHIYSTASLPHLTQISQVQKEIALYEVLRKKPGNLAFEENGTFVRAQYNYPGRDDPLHWVINGITDGSGWWDTSRKLPTWLEVLFPDEVTIGRVVLYTPTLQEYELQALINGKWQMLEKKEGVNPGSPVKPEPTKIIHRFSPVKTIKIRFWVTKASGAPEVNEVEVYEK